MNLIFGGIGIRLNNDACIGRCDFRHFVAGNIGVLVGAVFLSDPCRQLREEIRSLAVKAYSVIDGEGFARVDFFIDRDTGKLYLNEINTIPGSLSFYLWAASGIKYPELCDKLIELAFRRQRNRENLTFTIDTNILSGVSFGTKGSKGAKL